MKIFANSIMAFGLLMIILFVAYLIGLCGCDPSEIMRGISNTTLIYVCFQVSEKIIDKIKSE